MSPQELSDFLKFVEREAEKLKEEMLSRLQPCRHCSQLFYQTDLRMVFCSPLCRADWFNKDRLQSGYFEKRRKNLRAKYGRITDIKKLKEGVE